MSKENKLIPELRFPEFENDREWVEKKLGTLGEPLMCKRILKEQTTTNPKNGVPFYKIGTFGKKADAYIPIGLYEEFKSKYSFPQKGDILISASGTIGRLVIYDGLPAFFQDSNIVWLGNDESLVQNIFLHHCYTKIKWQTSDGGIISRLYNSDLRNMEIHFPKNKIEQQKIASCLSSLDEIIATHSQKLNLLKDHKKGMMQNLFPHEGEKVPKYRFKEFENDGEWCETTLGDIGNFIGGGTPDTTKAEYWNGDIQWYTPTEVKEGKVGKSIRTITELGLKNSSAKLLPKGSLLLTTRATIGDIAIADFECTTNQGFQSLVVKETEINTFWFYWIIRHKNELIKKSSGSTFPEIGKTEITKINALKPNKPEQQKIASCLSSLDALITAQAEKIEQLKLHKKGLMQGLFPKIEI
jgi:type I restriction enzyme S subunit